MITREEAKQNRDPHYWVMTILGRYENMFLTKEEIYAQFPTDENNVSVITMSSLDRALHTLLITREIEYEYVNNKRYYGINTDDKNKRGW